MYRQSKNAYLTVYLALVFGVVLSLLLALIEGAAVGAARLQSEIVADLGLDSVFAEYNRELLDQYEVFFIDSSYGTINSGVGMVEKRISDYMGYNINPKNDKEIPFLEYTLLYLENPYLEIDEISYATDDDCLVWKSAAVNYMKSSLGGDIVSSIHCYIDTVEEKGLNTKDVVQELKNQKRDIDKAIEDKEIEESSGDSGDGYTYDNVSSVFDRIVGGRLLNLATLSGASISSATVEGGPFYSVRSISGNINKGSGLHEGVDSANGVADELIYNEYLMKMCGTFTNPKDKGLLKYQIEYILYGLNSDNDNMEKCAKQLFALRAASNATAIYSDSAKKAQVTLIVTPICLLLLSPELVNPITNLILGTWAVAEALSDVKILLNNGKVPLVKSSSDWNISLTGLFSGSLFNGGNNTRGLSYNDYLRIFLGLANKNEKLSRSLDIVEMDIRQTDGNSGFRIDGCADYISAKFGFRDGYGHEFLLDRKMCYE